MKYLILSATMFLLFSCNSPKKQLDNQFYVFNNCVRTLPAAPETLEAQILLVKELGYDGFAGHRSDDNLKLYNALTEAGLKMPEVYWGAELDSSGNFMYNKEINTLPYLYMISINGADSGNTREMDWDQLIQPLGEGTFDTYQIIKLAKDNGYDGLFGLQCYNIKTDCEIALAESMNTWKKYQKKYAEE